MVAAGTVAVLARDEVKRAWWRLPGVEKPRKAGELDYAGASWVAASEANWRRADRPDDYRIDRVIIHVTQGSFDSAVQVFQDPAHQAATHYIVGQDGQVAQMIRELDVAFHAGNRSFNERSRRHRARGLRGPPEGLHGGDVRVVGAADGRRSARGTTYPSTGSTSSGMWRCRAPTTPTRGRTGTGTAI